MYVISSGSHTTACGACVVYASAVNVARPKAIDHSWRLAAVCDHHSAFSPACLLRLFHRALLLARSKLALLQTQMCSIVSIAACAASFVACISSRKKTCLFHRAVLHDTNIDEASRKECSQHERRQSSHPLTAASSSLLSGWSLFGPSVCLALNVPLLAGSGWGFCWLPWELVALWGLLFCSDGRYEVRLK